MDVRVALAGLALLGLTACSSPAPTAAHTTAPVTETSSAAAPTETSGGSQTSATAPDLSGISSYGVTSKECTSAADVLQAATKVGLLASQGKLTQDEFDSAYGGAVSNDLPVEMVPLFADLKTASAKAVGLGLADAQQHLSEFSLALGSFTAATQKVCS
jgi:hypothetical protein